MAVRSGRRLKGGISWHAAVALEESQILARETPSRIDLWFTRIIVATQAVGSWNPMDARAVDGILVLDRRDTRMAPRLFGHFVNARITRPGVGDRNNAHGLHRRLHTVGVRVEQEAPASFAKR